MSADPAAGPSAGPVNELPALIDQASAGDAAACQALHDRYHRHVVRIVRYHINARLRSIVDFRDLAQNVWKSFFGCIQEGRRFDTPEELLAFLAGITRNKTLLQNRYYLETDKRSLSHEESFAHHEGAVLECPAPGASPADQVAEADEWDQLRRGLPETAIRVLEGLRRGESLEELAQRLGVSVKTIRRVVERCRKERVRPPETPAPGE